MLCELVNQTCKSLLSIGGFLQKYCSCGGLVRTQRNSWQCSVWHCEQAIPFHRRLLDPFCTRSFRGDSTDASVDVVNDLLAIQV